MPIFHTTSAYNAKNIILNGVIDPRSCDVFRGEKISYFFYGRPSYKMQNKQQIAKYWQLPSVFIFDSDIVDMVRCYPFDTGAFEEKLYPEFFNFMPRDSYEVSEIIDGPQRLISAFFVDTDRFFKMKPREKSDFVSRFQVRTTDEEVSALYDVISTYSEKVDERRFSIELQSHEKIDIYKGKCRAIIIPEEYLESDEIVEITDRLEIELLSYPSFPLRQEMYYYAIYNVVYELYKEWGLAR